MTQLNSQQIRLLLRKPLRQWADEKGHSYANVRVAICRWVNNAHKRPNLTPTSDTLEILLSLSDDLGVCVCPAIKPLMPQQKGRKTKQATGA